MDDSEHDVLAYMTFPNQHRTKLHSRMRSTSFSDASCYPGMARVTARQRAGLEDASPTT
jgi:hypothetical protein